MDPLIAASRERKKWFGRKILVRLVLTLLFFLSAEGIYLFKILKIYSFPGLWFPLKSLAVFEGFFGNPPVIVFLIGAFLLKLLLLLSLSVLTAILSAKLKARAGAALLVILIVPSLFWLLGIRSLKAVSAGHYFAVFPWLVKGTIVRIICLAAALLFIGAAAFIAVRLYREQERKGITCG